MNIQILFQNCALSQKKNALQHTQTDISRQHKVTHYTNRKIEIHIEKHTPSPIISHSSDGKKKKLNHCAHA